MTVTVRMLERRVSGTNTFYEAGVNYTLDDATAAFFVHKGYAVILSGRLVSNNEIPATIKIDDTGSGLLIGNGKTGVYNRLNQSQPSKSWRDMEAFIAAPNWTATTNITNGRTRKHSSGELLICTSTGDTGATEPALTNNGIITDGTVTWSILGRASKVASGLVVPTITNGTIETNVVDRRLPNNPNYWTRNAYFAGGLTPIYTANDEKVWRFTDAGNFQKANGGYEFYSDAVVMSIETGGATSRIRVYVDILDGYGYRLVEEDPTPTAWYRIDWKGSRRMRLYKVMHSLGSGGMGAARISTTSTLDQITIGDLPNRKLKRAMFFSDSFGRTKTPDISASPNFWNEEWQMATMLGSELGCDFTYDQSDGGIGYTQASGTGTIRTHLNLTAVSEVPIDYVIIAAGFNDRPSSVSLVAPEALLTWQTARALYPNAKIIIVTAWQNRDNTANALVNEAAYVTQFTAWADPNSVLIRPIGGQPFAWITGTGFVGATTGNGNSDLYTCSDATHPTPIGMLYLVDKIATAARAALNIDY